MQYLLHVNVFVRIFVRLYGTRCIFLEVRSQLNTTARSPLFSHITATLQGLTTIKACGRQDASMEYFHAYQDEQSKGWCGYICASRWLGLRIDLVSSVFIAAVVFMAIPLASSEQ